MVELAWSEPERDRSEAGNNRRKEEGEEGHRGEAGTPLFRWRKEMDKGGRQNKSRLPGNQLERGSGVGRLG